MDFVKMEGLGNDFIVVAGPMEPEPEAIVRWCLRRRGIGADGVLEVTPRDPGRVAMRYWNADGSPSEMCGNGLRCVARYSYDRGLVTDREFLVETAVGDRPVRVREDGTVRALLGVPHAHRVNTLSVAGVTVHPVGIGNPHAVLFVDDPAEAPVEQLGKTIGMHAMFPDGANVEFLRVVDEERIELRVWERGVGETLACGSGAAAAAFVAHHQGHTKSRVSVALPGGDLIVELDDDGAWLDGPANEVFVGQLP